MEIDDKKYNQYINKVRFDGSFLQKVPDEYKTEFLCTLAVMQNGFAIKYVNNQTANICYESVKRSGTCIAFVNKEYLTPELCLVALKNNFFALSKIIDLPSVALLIPDEIIEKGLQHELTAEDYKKLVDLRAKLSILNSSNNHLDERHQNRKSKVSI